VVIIEAGDEVIVEAADRRADLDAALIADLRLIMDDAEIVGAENLTRRAGIDIGAFIIAVRAFARCADRAIALQILEQPFAGQAISGVGDADRL
jgi:hypothetical protein